ncbi:MAG: mycothiol synthase [Actinomycetota bacterium]|nr:mycothiol synthase [Actinomycetota bacterium]
MDLTARVTELAARAGAVLSEQARIERRYAGAGGPVGVVVLLGQRTVGYAHLVSGAEPTPGWDVELVGDPAQPEAFPAVLAAVLAEGRRVGVPQVRWWAPPSAAMGLLARGFQMECDHVLYRLEAPLIALATALPPLPDGLRLRALAVPSELESWLTLNRRAFAAHPTQRRWTRADVERRVAQPWFDPQGFLVAEADGRLMATCWVKPQGDGFGELYVVGVDPSLQGLGLGRVVARAGLHHLASRGAHTAFLYVAGHNDAALRLYNRLGFAVTGSQTIWRAWPDNTGPPPGSATDTD